ncbi:MAG: PEP-CTERM sorting domain-containing protein [Armatimonadetes bacterium]|nr:PEP-CTERM sorting domain-containing protein [Armatimonadota bacterium]
MNKLILVPLGVLATATAFGQGFFPYDSLVVARVNGTTSAANSVDLVGFNFDGTSNSKVFGLGSGFTLSGSATSEGQMNASLNYLALGGYSATVGTASVASTTTARRVAVYDNFANGGLGGVNYVDLQAGVYSANNIRSAYTTDGTTVLTGGTATSPNGGWRTTTAGTSTELGTTQNVRVIKEVGGTTYGSTGSASGNAGIGIYSVTPGAETLVQLTGGTGTGTASPYDFEFYNENSTDYTLVADDRSTANGGGLQVYKNGSLFRTIALPSTTSALRSIAVRSWNNNGVQETTVFGIANANKLVGFTFDNGTLETTSNSFAELATADTGTVFRSIEIVPEPASLAIVGIGLAGLASRRRRKN